jgi:two-component system, cell cycle response regulator DivK
MDRRRPRKPPTRPLVLLIEGHQDTRALYALALSAIGFEVVAVPERTEAFRRAWEIRPDIIVTDLPLPNDEGGQFVQDLKQNPRTRDIPLVAVSGYVDRSRRDRPTDGGFAAFFAKPCLPDALAAGLWRVLDKGFHAHVEH